MGLAVERNVDFLLQTRQELPQPVLVHREDVIVELELTEVEPLLALVQFFHDIVDRSPANIVLLDPLVGKVGEEVVETERAPVGTAASGHGPVDAPGRSGAGVEFLVGKRQGIEILQKTADHRRTSDLAVGLGPDVVDAGAVAPAFEVVAEFQQRHLALTLADKIDLVVAQHEFGNRRGVHATEDCRDSLLFADTPGNLDRPLKRVGQATETDQVGIQVQDVLDDPVILVEQLRQQRHVELEAVVEQRRVVRQARAVAIFLEVGRKVFNPDQLGPQ